MNTSKIQNPKYLTVALVLLLVAVALGQMFASQALEQTLRWQLTERLSESTGGEAQVHDVQASLMGHVALHGLHLSLPEGPLAAVDVDHAEVEISLWGLLFGDRNLESVAIDRLALVLRAEQMSADSGLPSDSSSTAGATTPDYVEWLPLSTRLASLDVSIEAAVDTSLLQLSGLLTLTERPASDLDGAHLSLELQSVRARGAPDRPWNGSGQVLIATDRIELIDIRGASERDTFSAHGQIDSTVAVRARLDVGLENLWRAALKSPLDQDVPVAGRALTVIEVTGDASDLEWRARLDLPAAGWKGIPLHNASASLRYRDQVLHLDSLRAGIGTGQLRGSGRFDGRPDANEASLHLALDRADAATLDLLLTGTSGASEGQVDGDVRLTTRPGAPDSLTVVAHLSGREVTVRGLPLGTWQLSADYARQQLQARLDSDVLRLTTQGTVANLEEHELQWRVKLGDPDGLRRVSGIDIEARGSVSAVTRGHLVRPELELDGRIVAPRIAAFGLSGLSLSARADSLGRFLVTAREDGGGMRLKMQGDLRTNSIEEGYLTIVSVPLADLLRTPDAAEWAGAVTAELSFSGSTESPAIDGQILLNDLGYAGQIFGRASGTVTLEEGRGLINLAALDSGLVAAAQVDLIKGLPLLLTGQFRRADLKPLVALAAAGRPGMGGHLSARFDAKGNLGDAENLQLSAAVSAAGISTPRSRLSLASPAQITVRQGVLQMENLVFAGSGGQLVAAGSAARTGDIDMNITLDAARLATLEPFLVAEEFGLDGAVTGALTLTSSSQSPTATGHLTIGALRVADALLGNLDGRCTYVDNLFTLDELFLDLPQGRVLGTAQLPVSGDTNADQIGPLTARLELTQVRLDSMQSLPPGIEMLVSGVVELSGKGSRSGELTGSLELDKLELASPRFLVSNDEPVRFRLQDGHIGADSLQFDVTELADSTAADTVGSVVVSGSTGGDGEGLVVKARGIGLEAVARLAGSRRQVEGTMDADLQVRGRLGETRMEASWEMAAGMVDSLVVADVQGSGRFRGGELSLDSLSMSMAGGSVQASGSLPLGEGAENQPLALDLALKGVGLTQFRRLLDPELDDIETLTGKVSAELSMAGTPSRPVADGHARIEDVKLEIANLDPAFSFDSAQVVFADDSVRVSGLEAGNGSWRLSALAALDGLRPRWFTVSAGLEDFKLELRETMSLKLAGDLTWEGDPERSRLHGQLRSPSGEITEPMSLRTLAYTGGDEYAGGDELVGSDSAAVVVDSSGGHVVDLDLYVEGRKQRLRNELVDLRFEGDLAVSGTAQRPVLDGEIRGLGGTLSYLDHLFALERASIRLNNPQPLAGIDALFHDPASVDPEMDLSAKTELTAKNGNEYQVSMAAFGRVSDLRFELTSEPEREPVDVLSLLAFGQEGVPMMDATGLFLGGQFSLSPSYLLAATENQFGRVLHLDDVSIDSSVLKPGQLSGSRVVLTKQLSDKMEMTYSTTVGYAAQGRVQLQYDLGRSLFMQSEHDALGESGMDLNLKLKFK